MVAVDICNLALSYLGDTATVASIDPPEGSAQAQHCARFYPIALRMMLESHQWNFVTKRAYLAEVQGCYFNQWRFVYALPADALAVISILPKTLYPANLFDVALANYFGDPWPYDFEQMWQYDFQIEAVNGQQAILTNVCDAVARYTVSTVQPGMFPALFTDALAWKLASMLAGPLMKGDVGVKMAQSCMARGQLVLEQAKGKDANQRHDDKKPVPSNIRARR